MRNIPNEDERARLLSTPTSAALPPGRRARLVHWGCELLVRNQGLQSFLDPQTRPSERAEPEMPRCREMPSAASTIGIPVRHV